MDRTKKVLFFLTPALATIFFAQDLINAAKGDFIGGNIFKKAVVAAVTIFGVLMIYLAKFKREEQEILEESLVLKIIFVVVVACVAIFLLVTALDYLELIEFE